MSLGVHQDDGVGGYFRVVGFKEKLDRRVEIVRGLFHQDRLRQRLRMRGRELKRREKLFRRRRLEIEVEGLSWVRWRRVGTRTPAQHDE